MKELVSFTSKTIWDIANIRVTIIFNKFKSYVIAKDWEKMNSFL